MLPARDFDCGGVCEQLGCDMPHRAGHEGIVDPARLGSSEGNSSAVPTFGPRVECTRCGIIGTHARPNWQEQPLRETLTGVQWR
jgi:hypothetical protein